MIGFRFSGAAELIDNLLLFLSRFLFFLGGNLKGKVVKKVLVKTLVCSLKFSLKTFEKKIDEIRSRAIRAASTRCTLVKDTSISWRKVSTFHQFFQNIFFANYSLIYVRAEAFGTTWSKHYCQFSKENRIFTMIPYTQTAGKIVIYFYLLLKLKEFCKMYDNA